MRCHGTVSTDMPRMLQHFVLPLLGLLCASALHAAPEVDYVTLGTGRFDCDDEARAVCRERDDRPDTVATMLAHAQDAAREGNRLRFAFRGQADAVLMSGGLQYPLSRVTGTDHWTLTLRVARLDELAFEYAFVTQHGRRLEHGPRAIWRGPRAAIEPRQAKPLRGRVGEHLLMNREGAPRKLSVYEPPVAGALHGTVYMTDGRSVPQYARFVEPLILAGELPPLLLVGLHAADGAERQSEYVAALHGGERFAAHERFFLHEALPYVERRFAVPKTRERRVLAGSSNGADWAVETVLRHPDRFAGAIAFSLAWPVRTQNRFDAAYPVHFELAAGTLEGEQLRRTRALHRALQAAGVPGRLQEVHGGHDAYWWQRRFPDAARAHFMASDGAIAAAPAGHAASCSIPSCLHCIGPFAGTSGRAATAGTMSAAGQDRTSRERMD